MHRPAVARFLCGACVLAAAHTTLCAQTPASVFLEDYTWQELRHAIATGTATDTSGSGALDARGVSGDPRAATPQLGREFGDIRVRDAVAQIRSLLASQR